ncbi:MAG: hypothetical protein WC530_03360 [Candidatus Omnitrophota bacterium]
MDSIPRYACRFVRAKSFKRLSAFGKELGLQTFHGFRPHVKINSIEMVQELTGSDSELLVCDRDYFSQPLLKKS